MKFTKQEIQQIITEEYNYVLKEQRINNLYRSYNKLSLTEKKECEAIGLKFYKSFLL